MRSSKRSQLCLLTTLTSWPWNVEISRSTLFVEAIVSGSFYLDPGDITSLVVTAPSARVLLWKERSGMPIIQSSQALTALQTVDDVLVNNILASNFTRRYAVTYAVVGSATGISCDIKVGLNLVAQNVLASTQNRMPIFPDDYQDSFGVIPGDRIILTARETSNNARTLFYGFRFRPI